MIYETNRLNYLDPSSDTWQIAQVGSTIYLQGMYGGTIERILFDISGFDVFYTDKTRHSIRGVAFVAENAKFFGANHDVASALDELTRSN